MVIAVLSLFLAVTATDAPVSTPHPVASLPPLAVRAPKAALTLEIANDEASRERGLMNRTSMPVHRGMLFVFDSDGPVEFWMKDTLIPLDMVFVGADGSVRRVFASVPVVAPSLPDEQIPREDGAAKYVIELNAGEAAQDGIVKGTKLSDVTNVSPPQ